MPFIKKSLRARRKSIANARSMKKAKDSKRGTESQPVTEDTPISLVDSEAKVDTQASDGRNKRSAEAIAKPVAFECVQVLDSIYIVSEPQSFVCESCKCMVKDPVQHMNIKHQMSHASIKSTFDKHLLDFSWMDSKLIVPSLPFVDVVDGFRCTIV